MQKISVHNLVLAGIHGVTEKEKYYNQSFSVEIEAEAPDHLLDDQIQYAVDYRVMRHIATSVVEGEHCHLIETLASAIADQIIAALPVTKVSVTVRKLTIWPNGVPSVTVCRYKLPARLNLLDFSVERVLEDLLEYGGASLPILPETRRTALLEEARNYPFEVKPETTNGGLVREETSGFTKLPLDSQFYRLRDDFSEAWWRQLHALGQLDIFTPRLNFTELSLQKYNAGSLGITPHRDGKSMLNLIAVFILTGHARFALCDDRAGSNPRYLDTTPGNVLLLRGPGLCGSSYQPFHFVTDVTDERVVFGLRQKQLC